MKTVDKNALDRRVSVAPMMGWTDRHDRYFLRLISPHALLYTVMLTSGALVHGDKDRFLAFSQEEQPVALQLGGSDPAELAKAAKAGQAAGYQEINLNCGCPSDRVQKGAFGACLMATPRLVAQSINEMMQGVDIPVTVKTRIGIDEQDSYEFLTDFVGTIAEKGCGVFIIHARKAWLNGLSPKDNRTIPPLDWPRVYKLKQDFPHLTIILNGGITTLDHVREGLAHVDGVMIGREAYQNPWFLAEIEREIFGLKDIPERHEIVEALIPYAEKMLAEGADLKDISRHTLGLFQGLRGAKAWRRLLSEQAHLPGATPELLSRAAALVATS